MARSRAETEESGQGDGIAMAARPSRRLRSVRSKAMAFPALTLVSVTNLLVVFFVVATMFSLGLGLTLPQIAATASRFNLMGRALLVNVVLIPVLAYVLVRVLPTNPQLAVGVLLVAMAPGAAYGPKLTQIARADVPLSVGIVAIVAVLIVVTLPATAALTLPGEIVVDSLALVQSMVLVEILPLALGLVVHARVGSLGRAIQPWLTKLSTVLFVLVILATIAVSWPALPSLLHIPSIFAALGTMVGSVAFGYWLGGPGVGTRQALAITSLSRYAGIALFVADSSFPDPHIRAMIVAYGLIEVILGAILVLIWRRQHQVSAPVAVPEEQEARRGRAA